MTKLVYIIFFAIFLAEFKNFPRVMAFIPDLLSAVVLVVVVAHLALRKTVALHPKYFFVLFMLLLIVLVGVIANPFQPGAVLNGLRFFGKHIPIFLLPAVYCFSDQQIHSQLRLLLALALVQSPIGVVQFFVYHGGDPVAGTVGLSSTLSILLICIISVVYGFYLKKKITSKRLLTIVAILLLPVVLNETTVSILILPVAFIVPAFFYYANKGQMGGFIKTLFLGGVVLVTFIVGYDSLYGDRWGGTVLNVFSSQRASEYVYRGDRVDPDREFDEVGRVDSIVNPVSILAKDPVIAFIGVGIGNATESFSDILSGHFAEDYWELGVRVNTLSKLLWEIGIVGALLFFLFYLLVFLDSRVISKKTDIAGALALGWTGVLAILLVCTIYKNVLNPATVGYLLAYISGYIVSKPIWDRRHNYSTSRNI